MFIKAAFTYFANKKVRGESCANGLSIACCSKFTSVRNSNVIKVHSERTFSSICLELNLSFNSRSFACSNRECSFASLRMFNRRDFAVFHLKVTALSLGGNEKFLLEFSCQDELNILGILKLDLPVLLVTDNEVPQALTKFL